MHKQLPDVCYYCGGEATSKEHVPPRTLFPKAADSPDGRNYRETLITVPACDEHNAAKSNDDEYLKYTMVLTITANEHGRNQFATAVMRAIERRPALLDDLLDGHEQVFVDENGEGQLQNTIAVQPDMRRLRASWDAIARGLYFYHNGRVFDGTIYIVDEFTLSLANLEDNDKRQEFARFAEGYAADLPKLGSVPDIFAYQYQTETGVLRMHFYGTTRERLLSRGLTTAALGRSLQSRLDDRAAATGRNQTYYDHRITPQAAAGGVQRP
tara:strand:+ start:11851 stop:12657 length:807 start_codon:yes stop_codon:yes gene_type:complete